jgi:hypothetical protein
MSTAQAAAVLIQLEKTCLQLPAILENSPSTIASEFKEISASYKQIRLNQHRVLLLFFT